MRNTLAIALGALIATVQPATAASDAALAKYKEADFADLKIAPEKHKNERIWFVEAFRSYFTTFPPYVEKSGFKGGRYIGVEFGTFQVPALAKKTDEVIEAVKDLKLGDRVKVYGRMKKFTRKPKNTVFPRYYLKLDKIELVERGTGVLTGAERKPLFGTEGEPPQPAGKRPKRWR